MLNTLGTYMFTMAFGVDVPVFKLGYGSAIAVVMFLMVALFVGGFRKSFRPGGSAVLIRGSI